MRQGCGLSPLLYVLCIEPLTRMLCLSPNISGCFIPGSGGTLKVVQYADDTTVILRDEASVTNVLSISNIFQQASGAKLNKEKCKGMWLGSLSHKFNTVNGVSFEHTDLKCLGFFFNQFHRNLGEANWSPILSKFSKVLKEWKTRNLTFRDRASVFACSKLWYVGKIILMEDRLVSNFKAVLFPFIWKGQNLFVCGISLTSGQLFNELFPDCTRSCFSQVVLRLRGGDRIYEMRCLFVAVGPNAHFIVLPHWDNMS